MTRTVKKILGGGPQGWSERLARAVSLPEAEAVCTPYKDLNLGHDHTALNKADPEIVKTAAVLMPIVNRHSGPTMLFTVRSQNMPSHPGQISFPGGRVHEDDDNRIDTALREAEEEVGILRTQVTVLGALGVHFGGMGFAVTPVVGLVSEATVFTACDREVAEIFEVPLAWLLDPANHIIEERHWQSSTYRMYAMPYERWHIWGLTAGMVKTLATLVEVA